MNLIETNDQQSGFTLMEMLVGLSIIGLLLTFSVTNFRGFENDITLDLRAEEAVSLIRQAQLWALTGQLRGGQRPSGGYGIRINECPAGSCAIIFFADFSVAGESGERVYNQADDDIVYQLNLPNNLTIENVQPSANLDIVYAMPEAVGYIEGEQSAAQGSFDLVNVFSHNRRTITVDRLVGQIDVN